MGLFTLFTYLNTKESHDRRITRRVWEFSQQISKAKYPKISQKYRSEISGRFRRTPMHCTERKTLQVSVIRRSGYVYLEKLKHPPLPSGYRISRCKMSVHGTSSFPIWHQNFGCEHPGWKVRGCRVQNGGVHPGANPTRAECCPDALRWYIRMPCSGILLVWIPKNSPQSQICFGDKKTIKTPKLNTIWLELIARVLNMLIGLKGDNYYSKVFKRVNYRLSNSTFWVVIKH